MSNQIFTSLLNESNTCSENSSVSRSISVCQMTFFRVCFLYNTFSNSFDGEKPDFHFTLVLTKVLTKDLYWKMFCVCQMTLEPCFWGCCFFKTHTGTAFDSELLDFHFRVWTEPKISCEHSSVSLKWLWSHVFDSETELSDFHFTLELDWKKKICSENLTVSVKWL